MSIVDPHQRKIVAPQLRQDKPFVPLTRQERKRMDRVANEERRRRHRQTAGRVIRGLTPRLNMHANEDQERAVARSQVRRGPSPSHVHPSGFVARFSSEFEKEQKRGKVHRLSTISSHTKDCHCPSCKASKTTGLANPLRSDMHKVSAAMSSKRREAILRGR